MVSAQSEHTDGRDREDRGKHERNITSFHDQHASEPLRVSAAQAAVGAIQLPSRASRCLPLEVALVGLQRLED